MQIQNSRTPVSQLPGIGTLTSQYLWSTYRFEDGDTPGRYNVFVTQQGQVGQGFANSLTSRETYLTTNPGQVPLNQKWECYDIGVEILPGASGAPVTVAQANQIYNKVGLAHVFGQTQVFEIGPVSLYPGGSGLTSAIDAADAGTSAAAFNGFPSVGARRQLRGRNIVLNPGDQWNMAFLIADADGNGLVLGEGLTVDVRVSLWMFRDLGFTG